MGSSDAERLSVLETRREDDVRRILAVENVVRTLAESVQAVVNNMDKDRAVHKAMSEADRRLARWCFAVVGLIVSVSSIWQALHEVLK